MSEIHEALGDSRSALACQERAVEAFEKGQGATRDDLLRLAQLLHANGRRDDAVRFEKKAYEAKTTPGIVKISPS